MPWKIEALVILAFAGLFVITQCAVGHSGVPIGRGGELTEPPASSANGYIDGLNPEVPVDDTRWYNATWFAIPYVPTFTYCINRVEFIHGEVTGTVTIQIREDTGFYPSDDILTEGSHTLLEPVGFQGADLSQITLTQGTRYWIVYETVLYSQASTGEFGSGDSTVYYYGDDGTTWYGVSDAEVIIARFYGDSCSAAVESPTWQAMTWGSIKALFE